MEICKKKKKSEKNPENLHLKFKTEIYILKFKSSNLNQNW